MKKLFAVVTGALMLCFGCLFTACKKDEPEPTPPLTVTDCFKDFVTTVYFKSSNKPQGYEDEVYSGEHTSLSELIKTENTLEAGRYSFFQIFTTEKASLIEVSSMSFDVVVTEDSLMQFCLSLSNDDALYSEAVTAIAGTPITVTFTGLKKRWAKEEAGASELRAGWMIGEATTYIRLDLVNRPDFDQNSYLIQNLKIEFTEL